ncbi:MAG: hypothetical protein ABJL67_22980 [Sulfitobacter sp.]
MKGLFGWVAQNSHTTQLLAMGDLAWPAGRACYKGANHPFGDHNYANHPPDTHHR